MNLSKKVIGCAMNVHTKLGNGFVESVYEHALAIEFETQKVPFQRQVTFEVRYRERVAGTFIADFVVDQQLVLELKAIQFLNKACESQLLNYLHASGFQVGLLLNFGTKSLEVRRMVLRYGSQIVI